MSKVEGLNFTQMIVLFSKCQARGDFRSAVVGVEISTPSWRKCEMEEVVPWFRAGFGGSNSLPILAYLSIASAG